jgi:hypothetical protein
MCFVDFQKTADPKKARISDSYPFKALRASQAGYNPSSAPADNPAQTPGSAGTLEMSRP